MTRTYTYTFAKLEVSAESYDEIHQKLEDAGYQHAFLEGVIDMHGIGLARAAEPQAAEPRWGKEPEETRDLLLLTGIKIKHDADELLAVCRVWSREQREAAERWATAIHLNASDHDDVAVPLEPEHVTALRRRP